MGVLEQDGSMPIAIVGIAGRFPGEAGNPEKLWDMIAEGRNAFSETPKDRFNIDAFYHPHAERQGSLNFRGAHFLKEDIGVFDTNFFSISPKEAQAMDPQHRFALEVSYEALENGTVQETLFFNDVLIRLSWNKNRRHPRLFNWLLHGFFHSGLFLHAES
jgi:acyl transferase domain-containing protein